ncbi:zinc finger BED domain-containing protein RICESLEEPER 2-like [Rhizophagus irregularis DAOM 181602=DAOM 197198]|nr:zinc finger BED domain-containing protein RICESLEEPER 2-like [Rhizophagus irregularis DAOM 181602=DAOM 197198]
MSKRRYREINADIEEETTEFAPTEEENLEEVESEDGLENQVEGGLPDNSNSGLSTLDENDRKGSFVWNHFDKFRDNNGGLWAKCRYCGGGKYDMSKGGSTGNLNCHLNKKFSNEIFRKNLAEWIAADDQPFTVVESPEFHHVIHSCNPMAFIPSADTVKTDILKLYKTHQSNMQDLLQNTPGKISFAIDAWTSPNIIGFLGITGHFIDVDWNLRNVLVDFIDLSGPHSGANLAKAFAACLQEKKILTKILGITADNAANNNTFLKSFEHTLQEILKQIKAEEAQDEDMILEEFCNSRTTHTYEMIPKLRRLIVKIRVSPQRRARFSSQCDLYEDVKNLNLVLDVKTRWNSTYMMLKRALELQKAKEWNQMKELCRVFEIFHKATVEMSKAQYITLSSSIPVYNILLDHLEKLLDNKNKEYCTISEIRTAITKGYEKLKTYYAKTDESHVYPIATILDPRMKLKYYLQQEWEQEYIDAAIKVIKDTYNEHYQNDPLLNNSNLEVQENDQENFFSLFEIGNDSSEEDELDEYLRKPVVSFKMNPLQWWKASIFAHEATYLRLAAMARDYLAIPGTSVPVERIFSGGTDLITKKRSSLGIETIRACMLLKNWIKYSRPFSN